MDSFMIYTEPFVVTGGGPGNSTTFLSIDLVKLAIGQFDLGPAAAMSLIYFLIILLLSWVFYTVMTNVGTDKDGRRAGGGTGRGPGRRGPRGEAGRCGGRTAEAGGGEGGGRNG